ncbi:MAG: FprA family A-type flavoprotein [archaeon]|nr:FprA family A-type flavoprotein [archaeon]
MNFELLRCIILIKMTGKKITSLQGTNILRAIVVFDTLYGNTEKIARALAKGIQAADIRTECLNIRDTQIKNLSQYDLIVIGGPTQYRTASKPMQDFLESLRKVNLSGKYAFTFDTRRDFFLAGSAAKFIEKKLRVLGLKIVKPYSSATVLSPEREEKRKKSESKDEWKERRRRSVRLQEGMEALFERIGGEVGRTITTRHL